MKLIKQIWLILTIYLMALSYCYSSTFDCDPLIVGKVGEHSIASPTRIEAMKSYLFHSIAYAQSEVGINAGVLAFVFKSRGSSTELFSLYSRAEWEGVFKRMTNAHKGHNVTKDISIEKLIDTLAFVQGALIVRSIKLINMVSPKSQQIPLSSQVNLDEYSKLYETWDSIISDPDYQNIFETLEAYSNTVLKALRTKDALNLSMDYRANVDPEKRKSLPISKLMDSFMFDSKVEKIMENALLEKHE